MTACVQMLFWMIASVSTLLLLTSCVGSWTRPLRIELSGFGSTLSFIPKTPDHVWLVMGLRHIENLAPHNINEVPLSRSHVIKTLAQCHTQPSSAPRDYCEKRRVGSSAMCVASSRSRWIISSSFSLSYWIPVKTGSRYFCGKLGSARWLAETGFLRLYAWEGLRILVEI